MAHQSTVTGGVSELIATAALLSAGWQISKPEVAEVYDRIGYKDGIFSRLQIKTIRNRDDRDGTPVIYATKGNGKPYTKEECDYIVGVQGPDVYLVKVRNKREYWFPKKPNTDNEWIKIN